MLVSKEPQIYAIIRLIPTPEFKTGCITLSAPSALSYLCGARSAGIRIVDHPGILDIHSMNVCAQSYRFSATLILFLAPLLAQGAVSATSNLERLSEASEEIADSIFASEELPDTLCLEMVTHPGDWVIEQGFMKSAERNNRLTLRCAPPFRGEVLIAITDLRVVYTDFGDEKILRRDVTVDLALSLPRVIEGKELRYTMQATKSLSDSIDRAGADDLATEAYSFTQPRYIEQQSTSFWKKIAEPLLVIGTTVTMVVLLFTTRS